MPERRPARIPFVCRVLIRAASLLTPRALRPEWLRKWRDGAGHWWAFLQERDEFLIRDGYAQLVRHCSGAFVDAFWHRFSRDGIRRLVRSPGFVLRRRRFSGASLRLRAAGSGRCAPRGLR